MKRLLLTIFLAALSVSVFAQNGSTLRFDEDSWDFGDIAESDGKVSHNFEFTNTGTVPVIIESVDVSCGCTSVSYPRAPVMPGKKSGIEITYDPVNRPGFFLKKIIVKSGKGRNVNTIEIKGTVTSRPRTVQEDYPFDTGQGVRFSASSINFVRVGQGQTKSMTLGYINTSKQDVNLRIVPAQTYPWFKIKSPDKLCAGCRGDITLIIDLSHTTVWGTLTIPTDVYINGIRHNKGLAISALATDNFDGMSEAGPRSKLDHQFFHFGDVRADIGCLSRKFILMNEGDTPLIIRAVQYDDGVTSTLREGAVVEPDRSIHFTVTIDLGSSGLSSDRMIRSMTLTMNDPNRPIREIRLVANLVR